VDLTIRWVDKIRSRTMTSVLLLILEKLALALEQGMARVLAIGSSLAFRASELAVCWGYNEAYAWRLDVSFWQALARMTLV
jgi:hypothetical protein